MYFEYTIQESDKSKLTVDPLKIFTDGFIGDKTPKVVIATLTNQVLV